MTVPVVRFVIAGAESSSAGLGRPYTLVFDGTCKVCSRLANTVRRWDRDSRIEVIPSQTGGLRARFPWIPARAYAEAVQLIQCPSGRTWQGAAAIEALLDILPRGKLISWIFSIPFARKLADRFYRWFARNRYRLGCGEHCQLGKARLDFGAEQALDPGS